MSTKTTGADNGAALLALYADGLDASVDGRGWNDEHDAARRALVQGISDTERLHALLKECEKVLFLIADPEMDDFGLDKAIGLLRAAITRAKERKT